MKKAYENLFSLAHPNDSVRDHPEAVDKDKQREKAKEASDLIRQNMLRLNIYLEVSNTVWGLGRGGDPVRRQGKRDRQREMERRRNTMTRKESERYREREKKGEEGVTVTQRERVATKRSG